MDRDNNNGRGFAVAQPNTGALASPDAPLPPVAIPDHELLRRIGRGSYGEVWLARNMMGMCRAVKIVRRRSFAHQRPFDRELSGIRKFEPVSRSHEGFIDVLHVGINEAEGCFYYVMEVGDDQVLGQDIDPSRYRPRTLAREIAAHGRLPFKESLQFGLALSLALSELHNRGLVHRDVKPSNIIFVNGVPKLADIGLVAEADEERSYVGTEGFIPPEGPGAPTADVFSLGRVLYEASTGRDRHDFPELPTLLDEFEDREGFLELNEVILQACQPGLKERYQSAGEMHADLLVIANGKSVKRLKVLERRLANLKRIGAVVSLALAVLVVLAMFLHQGWYEWRSLEEARRRQVGASVARGNRAMESGDLLGALPHFTEALRLDRGDADRELEHRLRIGSVLAESAKLDRLFFTGQDIEEAGFSPDGSNVLVTPRLGGAGQFEAATGRAGSSPCGPGRLNGAAYSPDGLWVVTCGMDGKAEVFRRADGAGVLTLEHGAPVTRARFSPDSRRIVTACADGRARVWDARTGRMELLLEGHAAGLLHAGFSHDGRMIVTSSTDGTVRLWSAGDGRSIGLPLEHKGWVNHAAFSPDDQRIVTGCSDQGAHVWDVATGRKLPPEMKHRDGVRSVEFSADGRMILTASLDGTVRLWRADRLEPPACNTILRHHSRVTFASFDPEGRRIVSACSDGAVRIWDLAGAPAPSRPARCVVSRDGSRLFHVGAKGIEVEDVMSGGVVCHLNTATTTVEQVKPGGDGRRVLSITPVQTDARGTNHYLRVWDAATGEMTGAGVLVTNHLRGASISDDGRRLATIDDEAVQTWDVSSGRPLSSALPLAGLVYKAVFSPGGGRIATLSGDQLAIWDAENGHPVFRLIGFSPPLAGAEFSPDGSRLVTYCATDNVAKCPARIWDAGTGEPAGPELNHSRGVLHAAFSPDGGKVVTACEDGSAYVWDAATGRPLTLPLRHRQPVGTARFSRDSKWIVTASRDMTARIWSAETGDPLTPFLRHGAALVNAQFLADGRRVITTDARGDSWLWMLPVEGRPVEELAMFAQLLGPAERPAATPDSPQGLWRQPQARHPANFTATARDIAAWHEAQALESELERQWFAAAFHLERLSKLRPGDPQIAGRLGNAKLKRGGELSGK